MLRTICISVCGVIILVAALIPVVVMIVDKT